jgi:predicted  nucleic acid-binding Zn-ribbon protein
LKTGFAVFEDVLYPSATSLALICLQLSKTKKKEGSRSFLNFKKQQREEKYVMNQNLIEVVDKLHEGRKAKEEEIDDLRAKGEIIKVMILLKRQEFRLLRDLKVSISSPRSEAILEKIDDSMESVSGEIKFLSEKRNSVMEEIQEEEENLERIKKEIEGKQEKYPHLFFYAYRN